MKNKISALLLVLVLVFALAGCGSKSTITISIPEIEEIELVEVPSGLESCSSADGVITVTVKEDGDYTFVINDQDGNEHSFTLKYHDKSVEAETDEELSINLGIE